MNQFKVRTNIKAGGDNCEDVWKDFVEYFSWDEQNNTWICTKQDNNGGNQQWREWGQSMGDQWRQYGQSWIP